MCVVGGDGAGEWWVCQRVGGGVGVGCVGGLGGEQDDAMVINRASFDRGFGHGHVYTHIVHDLAKSAPPGRSHPPLPRPRLTHHPPPPPQAQS